VVLRSPGISMQPFAAGLARKYSSGSLRGRAQKEGSGESGENPPDRKPISEERPSVKGDRTTRKCNLAPNRLPMGGPVRPRSRVSAPGPGRPTCAAQQVVSYLGYSGRGANAFGRATHDPERNSPRHEALRQLLIDRKQRTRMTQTDVAGNWECRRATFPRPTEDRGGCQ
jgi:hypothetical protein